MHLAHLGQNDFKTRIAWREWSAEVPQPPKTPSKFNCASFKKKIVELRCRKVVETSSYTSAIWQKMDKKSAWKTGYSWISRDRLTLGPQTPLGIWSSDPCGSFRTKSCRKKLTYAFFYLRSNFPCRSPLELVDLCSQTISNKLIWNFVAFKIKILQKVERSCYYLATFEIGSPQLEKTRPQA